MNRRKSVTGGGLFQSGGNDRKRCRPHHADAIFMSLVENSMIAFFRVYCFGITSKESKIFFISSRSFVPPFSKST